MDYLYGKLNNEVKNLEYKGKETDTALVSVDSKANAISVDVLKVPNKLSVGTFLGKTIYYDGGSPVYINLRSEVDDTPKDGSYKVVTSGGVKEYVDSKAGALEYVGGEGNFTNIDGGVTVKGRLNVDDGIYSPVTFDDPNFVPNNKSVDDKITASEQKLIDERIGAFTRTADKLFTDVTGGMTIKGHLNVDGGITSASAPADDTDVTNKGYVDDLCDTKLDKTGGTLTGDLIVEQNLIVKGTTTTVDTENLEVKDSLITVAKGNTAPLTSPAGIHVPKYDGTSDGALVFDASGTAYVGDVKLDESGNINTSQSDLQPIATRKGLSDGNLVKWDEANNTLVDSGKNVDDFAPRIKNTDQNWKCYAEYGKLDGSSEISLVEATNGPFAGAIIKRDDKGSAKVKVPTTDTSADDIVNRGYVDDNFVAKIGTETQSGTILYGRTHTGDERGFIVGAASHKGNTIVQRKADGTVEVATPAADNDATTKKYVDDGFVAKVTTPAIVYATTATDGSPRAIPWNTAAVPNTVVMRDSNGRTRVSDPEEQTDAANKKYVDDGFVSKTSRIGIVYCTDNTGNQARIDYSENAASWTIAQRDGSGHVRTADPEGQNDATTKGYVDSALEKKLDTYTGTAFYPVIPIQKRISASNPSAGYTQDWAQMSVEAINNTVAKRTAKGTLATATPKSDSDATPKKYVDDNFVAKVTTGNRNQAYTVDTNNQQVMMGIDEGATAWALARRYTGGRLQVGTPSDDADATTKAYVDAYQTITILGADE